MIKVNMSQSVITANVSQNEKCVANVSQQETCVNNKNIKIVKGDTGAVYTPHLDEECNLSWTNNGNLDNPPTVNIKGDNGDATVTPISNLQIEAILGGN